MAMTFGLRKIDVVIFSPHMAEVPEYAVPASCAAINRYVSFLHIKRGTKGGRLHFAAIRMQAQRHAIAIAQAIARFPHSDFGRRGLSLKQSLDLFSNVARTGGLTTKTLGVTPHELRHESRATFTSTLPNCSPRFTEVIHALIRTPCAPLIKRLRANQGITGLRSAMRTQALHVNLLQASGASARLAVALQRHPSRIAN